MTPLGNHETPPPYQLQAIQWLRDFRNTDLLQQMLARFYFTEAEIDAYRKVWVDWLKPNTGHSS
jgi:hypothetical protein